MDPFETSHLSDNALLRETPQLVAGRSRDTAIILTRLGEIDGRQLYRQAGYPSMYAYCIGELHLLEDSACRHIHVARLARRFPAVLFALAEHRVSMRAVLMLARHLTSANADELMAAATHKGRFEILKLLAERYPQPDLPERLEPISPPQPPVPLMLQPVPNGGELSAPERILVTIPQQSRQGSPEAVRQPTMCRVDSQVPTQRMTPLAPERFRLQLTLDKEAYDLLEEARALAGHTNPTGEILPVLKNALECYVTELRRRKYAATDRPGRSRPSSSARHIPAAVKRAVLERDGEQCAFVSEGGRRCEERKGLEFDHIEPVARGGKSTADNVRLLCSAHNQHAAERAFGAEFMERKRREAHGGRGARAR